MTSPLSAASRLRLRGVLARVRDEASNDLGLRAWLDHADRDIGAAFHSCTRGDWLTRLLLAARVDRTLLVYAATGCARAAVVHTQLQDERVLESIRLARSWAEADATSVECWAAGCAAAQAAAELAREAPALSRAAAAAAATAFACDGSADDSYWASRGYVIDAVLGAASTWADEVEGARRCADVVRLYVPLAVLLEAARSSTAPEPPDPVTGERPLPHAATGGTALPAGVWPGADEAAPMISFDPITGER